MPVDPISESLGARQLAEVSSAPSAGLGDNERSASTEDGSVAAPKAAMGTARSSRAEAGVPDVTPESGVQKPLVPEEQTTLPGASEGMVGHAIRPPSSQVVPPATVEEDEVEEIEHDEPRPQAV